MKISIVVLKARQQYAEDPDLATKPFDPSSALSSPSHEEYGLDGEDEKLKSSLMSNSVNQSHGNGLVHNYTQQQQENELSSGLVMRHPQLARMPSQLSSGLSSRRPSVASLSQQSRTQGRFKIDTTTAEGEGDSDNDDSQRRARFNVKDDQQQQQQALSMMEEKRGRFQVSSNANLAASDNSISRSTSNHSLNLLDLQEQINSFLKLSDQQRLLFQDVLSHLESKSYDESVMMANHDRQVNSLKRENDEMRREIDKLRQQLSRYMSS